MADRLVVRGAREHNLKGVDIDLPRDTIRYAGFKLIAVAGLGFFRPGP